MINWAKKTFESTLSDLGQQTLGKHSPGTTSPWTTKPFGNKALGNKGPGQAQGQWVFESIELKLGDGTDLNLFENIRGEIGFGQSPALGK